MSATHIIVNKSVKSNLISFMLQIPLEGDGSLLVAAIDFGTTYSGWAFSFKHEFESNPVKVSAKQWTGGQLVSLKGPTCVLIKSDRKTLHSFGFDAETKYATLAQEGTHEDWYFFKRFKMALFGDVGQSIEPMLEDASGKKLPAIDVFSLAIRYLKDDLIKMSEMRLAGGGLKPEDISWVITVPAIWNDAAKNFMREAANKAGIGRHKLMIALEPEAASLYCRHLQVEKDGRDGANLSKFKAGTKYLVLDAGGGTVDITVHEVSDSGNIKELHKASGGAWGGTRVDDAYRQFIIKLVGAPVMKKFMKAHMEDYIEMFRDFEIKKRAVSQKNDGKVTIRLPVALTDMLKKTTGDTLKDIIPDSAYAEKISISGDKLRVDANVVKGFFDESIKSILSHLKDLFETPSVRGCSAILMVGGFSESQVLQESIKTVYSNLKVILPNEAGLAVLKGAVIYGHRPSVIEARVSKYTYGTDISETFSAKQHPEMLKEVKKTGETLRTDIFSPLVKVGQTMIVGKAQEEHSYSPMHEDQTAMSMDIYATKDANPQYVTDPGCYKIASCTVPMPVTEGGKDRSVSVKMIFGGTEIQIECTDNTTGAVTKLNIEYQN